MRKLRVVDYDPGWPGAYLRARRELVAILPPGTATLHHVGSTSVPGLAAKPIVDILIDVGTLDVVDARTPRMVELGYVARGEHGIAGRRYFSRPAGDDPGVHAHAFASGDPRILRHLAFRDYLRAHPADAERYADVKRARALENRGDRGAYQAGKAALVEELISAALAGHAARSAPGRGGGPSAV